MEVFYRQKESSARRNLAKKRSGGSEIVSGQVTIFWRKEMAEVFIMQIVSSPAVSRG